MWFKFVDILLLFHYYNSFYFIIFFTHDLLPTTHDFIPTKFRQTLPWDDQFSFTPSPTDTRNTDANRRVAAPGHHNIKKEVHMLSFLFVLWLA